MVEIVNQMVEIVNRLVDHIFSRSTVKTPLLH